MRLLIIGNDSELITPITALKNYNIHCNLLPAGYPVEKLTFASPFDVLLYQADQLDDLTLEVIRNIKQIIDNKPLLLLVSSEASAMHVNMAYQCGVRNCIFTPFTTDDLLTVVKQLGVKESANAIELPFLPSVFRDFGFSISSGQEKYDLSVRFLGVFRLMHKGREVSTPLGPRQRSLLAYLMYYGTQGRISRDRLIKQFWPDHDIAGARNCLHVNLNNLRKALAQTFGNQEIICFGKESFFVNPALKVWRDVDIFMHHFNKAQQMSHQCQIKDAVLAYSETTHFGSEFLEDLRGEQWTIWIRDEFSEKYIKAHCFLADQLMTDNRFDEARDMLRRVLIKDNCLEPVHQQIIKCYMAEGRSDMAAKHYTECARIFKENLGTVPSASTRALLGGGENRGEGGR